MESKKKTTKCINLFPNLNHNVFYFQDKLIVVIIGQSFMQKVEG